MKTSFTWEIPECNFSPQNQRKSPVSSIYYAADILDETTEVNADFSKFQPLMKWLNSTHIAKKVIENNL